MIRTVTYDHVHLKSVPCMSEARSKTPIKILNQSFHMSSFVCPLIHFFQMAYMFHRRHPLLGVWDR